jgi:hypothetical protein
MIAVGRVRHCGPVPLSPQALRPPLQLSHLFGRSGSGGRLIGLARAGGFSL